MSCIMMRNAAALGAHAADLPRDGVAVVRAADVVHAGQVAQIYVVIARGRNDCHALADSVRDRPDGTVTSGVGSEHWKALLKFAYSMFAHMPTTPREIILTHGRACRLQGLLLSR